MWASLYLSFRLQDLAICPNFINFVLPNGNNGEEH